MSVQTTLSEFIDEYLANLYNIKSARVSCSAEVEVEVLEYGGSCTSESFLAPEGDMNHAVKALSSEVKPGKYKGVVVYVKYVPMRAKKEKLSSIKVLYVDEAGEPIIV